MSLIRLYFTLIYHLIKIRINNNFDAHEDLRDVHLNYYELIKSPKKLFKFFRRFSSVKFNKGKLRLYRGVRYPEDKLPITSGLGYCWTFDLYKAFPYNGRSGPQEYYFVYHALIKFNQINWKETILKSIFCHLHEKEIVVLSDDNIQLIIVDKYEKIPIVKINNKWKDHNTIRFRTVRGC